MRTLVLDGEEDILRCDLNVIDEIERKFVSVEACKTIAAAGVAGAGGDMDTSMAGASGRGPEGRDVSGGSSNHTGLVKEEGRQDS